MAINEYTISKIELPNGDVCNIKDTTYSAGTGIGISGTTISNTGVTSIKGNSENSYRTGQVNLTAANIGAVSKSGDTMTGNLIAPSIRIANTYYGITFGRTTATPVETILHTGIKWTNSAHMPVIHITGYAYGLHSPVEFKIGFYIYADKIEYCGVTNMGAWQPNVFLFKDTHDGRDYVGIGLAGSCYFLQLQADLQDEMGKFGSTDIDSSKWSWTFSTTTGVIPTVDDGTTCVQVPYKANILNPSKVNGHTVEANVPSNAKFTDTTYSAGTGLSLSGTTFSNSGVTSIAGKTGVVTLADLGLSNAMHFLGFTTTDVSSGTPNITASVSIGGSIVTAAAGDVVLYNSAEYVWGNDKWNLLGDESSYALKSTTLSGYGITDAKIVNGVITLGSNTITPLTSQYTTHLYVNATSGGATSNATTTNDATYIHLYDTSTKRETIQLKGAGGATVTATSGVITITSANDDTKNTAGSTNSTSKLYLIGAISQAGNSITNSYQYTYTNNGLLSALKLGLNLNGTEKAHLEWNNTDQSIDFIFE